MKLTVLEKVLDEIALAKMEVAMLVMSMPKSRKCNFSMNALTRKRELDMELI